MWKMKLLPMNPAPPVTNSVMLPLSLRDLDQVLAIVGHVKLLAQLQKLLRVMKPRRQAISSMQET